VVGGQLHLYFVHTADDGEAGQKRGRLGRVRTNPHRLWDVRSGRRVALTRSSGGPAARGPTRVGSAA
jgi:hypothetical protein